MQSVRSHWKNGAISIEADVLGALPEQCCRIRLKPERGEKLVSVVIRQVLADAASKGTTFFDPTGQAEAIGGDRHDDGVRVRSGRR